MNKVENPTLESIRRGVWAILAVQLLLFSIDCLERTKSDTLFVFALLTLANGMILLGKIIWGYLKSLAE